MQTFLPYADFSESARALDRQRLGKQRVEVLQILNALLGIKTGWTNHPAVRMWSGHEVQLVRYGFAICTQWIKCGYKDTCAGKLAMLTDVCDLKNDEPPRWLGNDEFHLSHRSNLIRKKPEHYGKLWPDVPNDLPYVWPT